MAMRCAKLSDVPVFEPYSTYIGCLASVPGDAGRAAFRPSFERKLNAAAEGVARS